MKRVPWLLCGMLVGLFIGALTVPMLASSYEERVRNAYWVPATTGVGLVIGLIIDVCGAIGRRD